jgi:hypothetical protein
VICAGLIENNKPVGIKVFDADGQEIQTIPISTSTISGAVPWAAYDTDGNGEEELLYVSESVLHAYSCSQQRDLWTRPLDFPYWIKFDEIVSADDPKAATLVLWSHQTVIGVSLATGAILWRCEKPPADNWQFPSELIYAGDALPKVISHDADLTKTQLQTVRATNAEGRYLAPVARTQKYPEYKPPIRYRPLPWIRPASSLNPFPWFQESFPKSMFGLMEWPLVLIGLGFVIYGAMHQRWRPVILCMAASGLLTACVSLNRLLQSSRFMESDERYSLDGWYWILWGMTIVMGFMVVLSVPFAWLGKRVRGLLK